MEDLKMRDEAVRRLAEGYKAEFVEAVAADERFHELLMDIAAEFVSTNIPITDDDARFDLSEELMLRCTTKEV